MTGCQEDRKILSLIDANLNRLLEGIRVCEEIMRFIYCEKAITLSFKRLRHNTINLIKKWNIDNRLLLDSRNSSRDVGRGSIKTEMIRRDYKNIFFANIQRAKESLRVLEEFSKLSSSQISGGFKNLRYKLYQLEQKANSKL